MLTDEQKYHVTVFNRAHNFLAMLESDPELLREDADPHTFLATAMASTVLPCTTSAGVFPRPLTVGCRFLAGPRLCPLSVYVLSVRMYSLSAVH